MPLSDAPGKARALYDARRDRVAIAPFTDADPDLTMADGYAVQSELTKLLLADGDSIVGYKVGLTSEPMQRMIGVDSPDYGPVLASTVYRDGDAVGLDQFIQPRIEAEIVFVLGSGLRGPGVSVLDAARAEGLLDDDRTGHEARDVRHVDQEEGAHFVGDGAERGEVDDARVRRAARDDQLRTDLAGDVADLIVVHQPGLGDHAIRVRLPDLPGVADRRAVRQVAAVRQ